METTEKKEFIDEFRNQWKSMWQNRLDDKFLAEGIANKDYSLLFVDKGTVIIATRKFKLLDFYEILQQHKLPIGSEASPPNPYVGGWGKFVRTILNPQNRTKGGREIPLKRNGSSVQQQLKKGGRGWLHFRR